VNLVVRTTVVTDDRPLLDLAPDDRSFLWVRDGQGLVAWGEAARLDVGRGPGRFAAAQDALERLAATADVDDAVRTAGTGLIAVGSFAFADGDSTVVVPRVVHGRRDGVRFRTTIDPVGAAPLPDADGPAARPGPSGDDGPADERPRFAGSSQADVDWLDAVARALAAIAAGDLDKVVLARDHLLWARTQFDARRIARRLAARFPGCHTFLVDGLVGATPELLIARDGAEVRSLVLAGTAPRAADRDADDALGAALLASGKDRAEHDLAVASVTGALAPHCASLTAEPEPHLLRLANVQHLASNVTGRLARPVPSLALAAALHPTAAVGGSPRDAALSMIARLERMDRGRYAAPVGWTDANGDGEWGIALRCAELDGTRARLFAGAGVVAGSLPEAELVETHLKLSAMRGVLGDVD
jgi:menaquinone-specific isochorismate synthase